MSDIDPERFDLNAALARIDDAEQRALNAMGIITGPTPAQLARDIRQDAIERIYLLLDDASGGTVDPDRAMDIATRAVAEACDNREGK